MTRGRYRWALAVVAVSAFMTTMDNTVVFTALPTIMADLDLSSSAKDWVATGYILMFSCLMITGGRLTDVLGCRLTFTAGMVVFTAASAVCGLAQTADVLVLARVVQGAGAALVLPAMQVMVTVGRSDRQRSIGNVVFIGAASTATAFGPAIGGVIVRHWDWSWIFLVNIVPGAVVTVLGLFVLAGRGENRRPRLDLPGVLISATMLFAFIYGLESRTRYGWTHPSVLSVFALGAIALVCFVLVESWAPDPMIDLRFFRNRVFTGGLLSQMLYGIGFNGMMFYSQPFLQRFLGFSPPEAGLVMLPPAITIMVVTPLAFVLAARVGPRAAIGAGMGLMGAGMILFSTLRAGDGYGDLMPGVMLVGVGAALGMPLVMYVLKTVPERRAGVASGVINVIREASGAFGIAILGLLVHTVPDGDASAAELEAFRQGTSSGLILGAVLVLLGGVIGAVTLPRLTRPRPGREGKSVAVPGSAQTASVPSPTLAVTAPLPIWTEAAEQTRVPGPHWWADIEPGPEDARTGATTAGPPSGRDAR
ncbi:MAG TPA: MFS transporter [Spirillospora sp.]